MGISRLRHSCIIKPATTNSGVVKNNSIMAYKKKQRHHVTPLSIGGSDHQSNITLVEKDDHKLIHDTLDVPYNTVRKYRGVMNERMFKPGKRQARAQARIEQLFFTRVKFIPKNQLQKAILDKLRENTRYLFEMYEQPYPNHKPVNTLQGEVEAELRKREWLYMYVVGANPPPFVK